MAAGTRANKIAFAGRESVISSSGGDTEDEPALQTPTKTFLSRYKTLAAMGNLNQDATLEQAPHSSKDRMQMTLSNRKAVTKTLRQMQAELNDPRDRDIIRLQQELKLSNATARELDQVILYKNQDIINEKATQASNGMADTRELGNTANQRVSVGLSAITMNERLRRAAVYIRDAIEGKETVTRSPIGVWLWKITSTHYYKTFMIILILCHMALVFGEPAAYKHYHSVSYTNVRIIYAFELIFSAFYAADIVCRAIVNGWRYFFKTPSRLIFIFTVVAIAADVIVALALGGSVRPTRCIRPFLLLTKSGTLREITSTIVRTIRQLVDLVLLIAILMVTYAVVGVQLYNGLYESELHHQNFDNISNSLLTLYALLTTENYPEIMIPAYNYSPWSIVYFLTYMFVVAYLMMSVLVAVVLGTYKSLRKEKLIKDRITERKGLATAFRLLDVDNTGHIDYALWENLFTIVSPKSDPTQVRLLFQTIDEDQNGKVNIIEFFELCDVLLLRFRKEDEERSVVPKSLLGFLNKYLPRRSANSIAKTRIFRILTTCLVIGNIVVLCLLGGNRVNTVAIYRINLAFLCLFVLEMLIKIIAWGVLFWKHIWNVFDFAIILIATVAQIAVLSAANLDSFTLDAVGYIRILNAISSLRILRVVSSFRRTRIIAFTVAKLATLMISVVSLLLCVFYFYAIIGMEIFVDIPQINEVTKFSSFPFAMLALFQQLTESDWHSVMYAAISSTSISSSWYFVTFNVIVVIIILNLLIALVIDTFVLQHDILTARQDILLEIPDPENASTKKSKWTVWKDLGRKWERELIQREDIPELQEEDFIQVSNNANNELDNLKKIASQRISSPLPPTPKDTASVDHSSFHSHRTSTRTSQ